MKREVWVDCFPGKEGSVAIVMRGCDAVHSIERAVLHESRWIPVSERMPTKNGHYHVFRLDREDWCYFEINAFKIDDPMQRFTSKGVTHWLEAPPLPVETEPTKESPALNDERFEQWYKYVKYCVESTNVKGMDYFKLLYDTARGDDVKPLPVEDEFEQFYQTFRHRYPREVEKFTEHDLKRKYREVWNAARSLLSPECNPPWRTSKDGIHCDYCGCFTDSHSETCKARATSSPASE